MSLAWLFCGKKIISAWVRNPAFKMGICQDKAAYMPCARSLNNKFQFFLMVTGVERRESHINLVH